MKSHDAGNLIHSETPLRADGDRDLSPDERQVLDLVNRKVAAAASLDDVMRFLFEATRTIIPCDRLSVHFLDDDGDRMMAQWVRVCYPTALVPVGYVQDMRGSSLRDIVDENVIRIIHDLEKYVVDHPGSDVTRLLVEEGNRSSLTCPLLVDDRVVGILVRGASAVRAFSEHHVLLHQLMAERLGQAVDRGYRNQQLAHANRAYMEMLGFVSHELKSPLGAMLTDVQLLRKGYLGEITSEQDDRLMRIERRGGYLMNLVREYLDLARIESGHLELRLSTEVDLVTDVIDSAMELVGATLQQRKMKLVQELPKGDIRVTCDPGLIRVVVINLLNNAAKYGRPEGEIRISLSLDASSFHVTVWNEGDGFAPEDRVKLFCKFSRLESATEKGIKGTGVGLYTVWRIIRLHQGTIEATSEPGQWAQFSFSVPTTGLAPACELGAGPLGG